MECEREVREAADIVYKVWMKDSTRPPDSPQRIWTEIMQSPVTAVVLEFLLKEKGHA